MNALLFALWFFLPAGIANATPILAAKTPLLSRWNSRMDFGVRYRGKAVFGEHKTWRGLLTGMLAAIAVVYAQQLIFQQNELPFLNGRQGEYLFNSPILLGILFGAGALIGDAVESFFKRQTKIKPGGSWFPFDQVDYIIGGCLATTFVTVLPLYLYAAVLAVWFLLHLVFSYIGFLIGVKQHPI